MVGGFPCQAFSIAGKRQGFSDERGKVFFDILRIIQYKKPSYLLLENVKGLLNHEAGDSFKTIIKSLTQLGYDLQWQVLNSKDFGLPQHRERIYLVGHLRELPRPQIFPFQRTARKNILCQKTECQNKKIKIRDGSKRGYDIACVGDSIDLSYINSKTRRGRVVKGFAHTLVTRVNQYTLTNKGKVRKLTPLECERLQGFPDFWTKQGLSSNDETISISDSQRYKCLGNAVSVPVVRAIIKKLIKEF